MSVQIVHLYALLCGAIMFFQIALIAGAPWGAATQGGRHAGPLPLRGRVLAALSIPVLVFQALAVISAAGFPGLGWPRWTWIVALAVQGATMLANWITPSPVERRIWAPITTAMMALAAYAVAF